MKKLILVLLLLTNLLSAQHNRNEIMNKVNLKGHAVLSDSLQLKVFVSTIIQVYGKAFRYYEELRANSYAFEIHSKQDCAIIILKDGKPLERINAYCR